MPECPNLAACCVDDLTACRGGRPFACRGSANVHTLGSMARFRLRIPDDDLRHWASRYAYPGDAEIEERIAPAARARGYLVRDEFLALCRWKTPRSQPRCAENRDEFVREVSRVALATADDELKIRVLLLLTGVSWPTASVILHFCDHGRYPILDVRALWSVGFRRTPVYTFSLWREYTGFVRGIGDRTGLPMRAIDRALWQYSKERQR
jgi:hypothetical protein